MRKETIENINWQPRLILIGLIAFYCVYFFAEVLANRVIKNPPADVLLGNLFLHAGFLLIPFLLVYLNNVRIRLFHLDRRRVRRELLFAIFASIAVVYVVTLLTIWVQDLFGLVKHDSSLLLHLGINPSNLFERLIFILSAVIVAPVSEEVFFRGFLYNAFKKQWGLLAAVLLQGVLFSVLHGGDTLSLLRPILLSFAFVGFYEYRRTIWAPIFVHCIANIPGTIPWLLG